MDKYCNKCGNKVLPQEKFCTKCGTKLSVITLSKFNTINKYKVPILIGVSFYLLFLVFFLYIIFVYDDNEEELRKENITRCYSEETYNKLMDLYDGDFKGNFGENAKCYNLNLEDKNYHKIIIIINDKKLDGIYVKDGMYDKYLYYIDKRYDIYDPITLEIKEKADTKLVNIIKNAEKKQKSLNNKKKKLKPFLNQGFSIKQASNAYKLLKEFGVNDFNSINKIDPIEGLDSYSIKYNSDILLTFSCQDYVINKIRYNDNILYDINTQERKSVDDFYVSITEMYDMKSNSEKVVKTVLKSPKTAKFPGSFLDPYKDWSITQNDGTFIVNSYVDSQNSFGAMLRSYFTIEFSKTETGYEVSSFVIDGNKYK